MDSAQVERDIASRLETIARLQAEIDILRGRKLRAAPFRFLDLPRELRDAVYAYLVAPGELHLCKKPRNDSQAPDSDDPLPTPQWSILAVNRQIREEAAELMLLRNHLVVHHDLDGSELLFGKMITAAGRSGPVPPSQITLSHLVQSHVRSLSFSVDPRNISITDPLARAGEARLVLQNHGPPNTTQAEKKRLLHKSFGFSDQLFNSLKCALGVCKSLRHLNIDFTNAYCISGCCRSVRSVAATFARYADWTKLETLEILGTKTHAERKRLTSCLQAGQTRKNLKSITVIFRKFAPATRDPALSIYHEHNTVAFLQATGFENLEEEEIIIGGPGSQDPV